MLQLSCLYIWLLYISAFSHINIYCVLTSVCMMTSYLVFIYLESVCCSNYVIVHKQCHLPTTIDNCKFLCLFISVCQHVLSDWLPITKRTGIAAKFVHIRNECLAQIVHTVGLSNQCLGQSVWKSGFYARGCFCFHITGSGDAIPCTRPTSCM